MDKISELTRNFFTNYKNQVVIVQKPNIPLIIWFILTVTASFIKGDVKTLAQLLAFGSLFTWAWLEVRYGSSPFRRTMGGLILVLSIVNAWHSFK